MNTRQSIKEEKEGLAMATAERPNNTNNAVDSANDNLENFIDREGSGRDEADSVASSVELRLSRQQMQINTISEQMGQLLEILKAKNVDTNSESDLSLDATFYTAKGGRAGVKFEKVGGEEEFERHVPIKERNTRDMVAANRSNIMLVSAEVAEFKEVLRPSDMSIYGIWEWLSKVEEHNRRYDTDIQLWRQLSSDVIRNFLEEGEVDLETFQSNDTVKNSLMKYLRLEAEYVNNMREFFSHSHLIKSVVFRKKAEVDRVYVIKIALNVLAEFDRAYGFYSKLTNHDPQRNIFNLHVFPDVTANGLYAKKQKVVQFWKAHMLKDSFLSQLMNQRVDNLLSRHSKVGWEVLTKVLKGHLEEQIESTKIAQRYAQDNNLTLTATRSTYRTNGKEDAHVIQPRRITGINNVEVTNPNLNESDNGSKELYQDQDYDYEDEKDDIKDDDIDQNTEMSEFELNAIENRKLRAERPCLDMLKTGVCDQKECEYDHKTAKQMREEAKYPYMCAAFIQANNSQNPNKPFQMASVGQRQNK